MDKFLKIFFFIVQDKKPASKNTTTEENTEWSKLVEGKKTVNPRTNQSLPQAAEVELNERSTYSEEASQSNVFHRRMHSIPDLNLFLSQTNNTSTPDKIPGQYFCFPLQHF